MNTRSLIALFTIAAVLQVSACGKSEGKPSEEKPAKEDTTTQARGIAVRCAARGLPDTHAPGADDLVV